MKIPIVDEQGNIIGEEERSVVHQKGLLHPEIFVLIKLKNNKFVFQKRSLTKDTKPGLFTFSVSGHIDLGKTKEEAAIQELNEETGIKEIINNLKYLGMVKISTNDTVTNTINNAVRYFFGYYFLGQISDLKIEEKDGAGFVELSLEELKNLNETEKSKFVETVFYPEVLLFFNQMEHENQS